MLPVSTSTSFPWGCYSALFHSCHVCNHCMRAAMSVSTVLNRWTELQ